MSLHYHLFTMFLHILFEIHLFITKIFSTPFVLFYFTSGYKHSVSERLKRLSVGVVILTASRGRQKCCTAVRKTC